MKKTRLIICGGRDFRDYALLEKAVTELVEKLADVEIVSGCAPGADTLGERFAEDHGLPVKRFPAKWDEHGKGAGPIRNREMGRYATHVIAFWDGESRGTEDMIGVAQVRSLPTVVVRYDDE